MGTKWNLPKQPPPIWLNPAYEVSEEKDSTRLYLDAFTDDQTRTAKFLSLCFRQLKSLGLSNWKALNILANIVIEVGWEGRSFRGNNLGGVKTRREDADKKAAVGIPYKWWRAPGNKNSGDPPWCYYVAYDTLAEFLQEWIERFVPRISGPKNRYHETGNLFWLEDINWFLALIEAGYKGEVTRKNPTGSFNNHKIIISRCQVILVQDFLGLTPDAKPGPKTLQKIKEYQISKGLNPTGIINDLLITVMFNS